MQYVPIALVAVGGAISLCAILAGFVLVVRHGGWQAAMQHMPTGRWSLPRRLLYSGAMGVCVCCLVFILFILARFPAGMPWSMRP